MKSRGSDIYVVETDYYDFGAGVQTQLEPWGDLGILGRRSHADKKHRYPYSPAHYIVGTISDHHHGD